MGRADVVIVGAGPAGAATAILLAEAGHEVVLLDRARFPRDKVCGEYLSPEGSRILDRLGVLKTVEASGARPVRGMRIVAPDGTTLVGDYPREGRYRGYRDHALTVPRRMLDATLVERARALPVAVREGFRVTDLTYDAGRVSGVEGTAASGAERLSARLVIGADGRASVVARRLGLVRPHPWLARLALMTYAEGLAHDPERGEIFVAPPLYSIVNPVGEGRVNLSLVVPLDEGVRHRGDLAGYFDRTLATFPRLSERLRGGARRVSPVRAIGPLAYRVAPPRHDGVLLVGDALGFLDPFTGEGIFTALRSAELAAEVAHAALVSGDVSARALAPAHTRRMAAFADKERVSTLLQRLIARPRLAGHVARRLARRPAELALLMGVIGDFVPARRVLSPRFLARLFV